MSGTVVALQQTTVIPLLPRFPEVLHTSPSDAAWLVTITLLTAAVGTPIVSRLADMFGKRLMMLVSLGATIGGSTVVALGDTFTTALVGRAVQGLGFALVPVGISLLRDELPADRIPSAVALMSATLGIGAAVGLPLAGLFYEHLGWHAVFWLSATAGAVLMLAIVLLVPESPIRTGGRFDAGGALLLSGAVTGLLLAVAKGAEWGWTNGASVGVLLVAAGGFAVWIPYSLRVRQPVVDLRTSVHRPVLLTNVAALLAGFAMYANMFTTTQQLQLPTATGYGFGVDAATAGLCLVPGGVAMILLAPVNAALSRRYGARITLVLGALLIAGGYVFRIAFTDEIWQVICGAAVIFSGTAFAYASMPILIMRSVPKTETASANGLNTLLRSIGTSGSSAVAGALLASTASDSTGADLPTLEGLRIVFAVAALASLAAAVAAGALPRRPAEPADASDDAATSADSMIGSDAVAGMLVAGVVGQADGEPIGNAVVTVLRIDGRPIDWGRTDNTGTYSVVLPRHGAYLVVTSADGWAPSSALVHVDRTSDIIETRLTRRLSLAGNVTRGGVPLAGVMVLLTRPAGDMMASTRADGAGGYETPLPPPGRYIVTVVDEQSGFTHSSLVFIEAANSARFNVEAPGEVATPG